MESSTTILNTAPVVNSVTLSPTENATNDIITATVDSTDLDGDILTHTWIWYVDGSAVQSTSNTNTIDTLDGVVHFDRDQQVYVEVTADDGFTSDSDTCQPNHFEYSTKCFQRLHRSTQSRCWSGRLTCIVQSNDIDGDNISLTYTWAVDNSTPDS